MTLCKTLEKTWIGNELFEIEEYPTFSNRKYVRFIASVSSPDTKLLNFDIPRDALSFLPMDSDPVGNSFLPASPLEGYKIVEKNNKLQRVYIGGILIYDRIKDGF